MWRNEGGFVVNEKGKVLEVQSNIDAEQRNIVVGNKGTTMNQQWDIIYVDEYEKEPKKGELNKKFGIFVERDFYVVSAMNDHRYLDLINNRNMVIKTPNKIYFHI